MSNTTNNQYGTKEWADRNLNCCLGCSHNCLYCYAKSNALMYNRIEQPDDWKDEIITPLAKVQKKILKTKAVDYMIPSSHDVVPATIGRLIEVYDAVLSTNPGHRILVVSKPHLDCIKQICDRYHDYKDRIMFRFTIKSLNDSVLGFWEPGAPCIAERISALKYAFEAGYETSLSCEPMLDNDIYSLVKALYPMVTHSIWLGPGNYMKSRVALNTNNDPEAMTAVNSLLAKQTPAYLESLPQQLAPFIDKIRWKENLRKILEDAGKI